MTSNTTTQIPIKNLYSLKKPLGACFQNCYLVFVIKQMHIYLFIFNSELWFLSKWQIPKLFFQ